jgi:ABC-2 type transport system permease protein
MNTPRDSVEVVGWRRLVNVTLALSTTEFKLRYHGSVFGYLWSLAKPLLLFGVLYVALTKVLKFGGGIAHYPAYLVMAIVIYTYFSETISQSVSTLVDHESLIRKLPLPLIVFPLSIALTSLFNLVLNLVAISVIVFANGVEVRATWLEIVPLIGVLALFTASVGTLMANLYVPFRDMRPISEVILQLGFWGSPIVYPVELVPESFRHILMLNPLAVILTQARHAVIDPAAPTAYEAAGGWGPIIGAGLIVVGVLTLSLYLHRLIAPRLAEQL